MPRVTVATATVDDVDALAAAWVALAAEQREHGSWLLAEPNRAAVREDISRRAVLGEALVARLTGDDGADEGADDGGGERADDGGGEGVGDGDADPNDSTGGDDHGVGDGLGEGRRVVADLEVDPGLASGLGGPDELPPAFLGFVSFGLEADGFERAVDRGVVHNLYVRPGARSRGVGEALLSAAETELGAAGVERVALEALAANERAVAFYRAAGYDDHRLELEKSLE